MPSTGLSSMLGVLLIVTMVFAALLALPGKGRWWRIGLMCLLLMAGAGTFLTFSERQCAVEIHQKLQLANLQALVTTEMEQGSRNSILFHEDGRAELSTLADHSPPSASTELTPPGTAPNVEQPPRYTARVAIPLASRPPPEHPPHVGGARNVLAILSVLFAATVVLKIATRRNSRTQPARPD